MSVRASTKVEQWGSLNILQEVFIPQLSKAFPGAGETAHNLSLKTQIKRCADWKKSLSHTNEMNELSSKQFCFESFFLKARLEKIQIDGANGCLVRKITMNTYIVKTRTNCIEHLSGSQQHQKLIRQHMPIFISFKLWFRKRRVMLNDMAWQKKRLKKGPWKMQCKKHAIKHE